MDMKTVGRWSYLIGMIFAVFSVFVPVLTAPWAVQLLIVLGIIAGIWFVDSDDVINHGLTYLGLQAVATTMDNLVAVGPFVTGIATAFLGFLGPVVLTAFLMWGGLKFLKK